MNETAINRIIEFMTRLGNVFVRLNGIGFWLFITGFTILMIIVIAIIVKLFINLVRLIPNLTISQFIKLLLVLAVVLMIMGFIAP